MLGRQRTWSVAPTRDAQYFVTLAATDGTTLPVARMDFDDGFHYYLQGWEMTDQDVRGVAACLEQHDGLVKLVERSRVPMDGGDVLHFVGVGPRRWVFAADHARTR